MSLYEDVVARLSMLGCNIPQADSDNSAVTYSINLAAERIKANINRKEIPEELSHTHVDMAAGLFLKEKKAAGQLGNDFDFSAPVKSITEGDVSVSFAGASDGISTVEARLDALLDSLVNPPQSIFAAFRRLKW